MKNISQVKPAPALTPSVPATNPVTVASMAAAMSAMGFGLEVSAAPK